jgi:hypothetical protein
MYELMKEDNFNKLLKILMIFFNSQNKLHVLLAP